MERLFWPIFVTSFFLLQPSWCLIVLLEVLVASHSSVTQLLVSWYKSIQGSYKNANNIILINKLPCATKYSSKQPLLHSRFACPNVCMPLDIVVFDSWVKVDGFLWSSVYHGQIISRPHTTDFPQKVAFVWKGNGTPKISGKSRLVKYYFIWPDMYIHSLKLT